MIDKLCGAILFRSIGRFFMLQNKSPYTSVV